MAIIATSPSCEDEARAMGTDVEQDDEARSDVFHQKHKRVYNGACLLSLLFMLVLVFMLAATAAMAEAAGGERVPTSCVATAYFVLLPTSPPAPLRAPPRSWACLAVFVAVLRLRGLSTAAGVANAAAFTALKPAGLATHAVAVLTDPAEATLGFFHGGVVAVERSSCKIQISDAEFVEVGPASCGVGPAATTCAAARPHALWLFASTPGNKSQCEQLVSIHVHILGPTSLFIRSFIFLLYFSFSTAVTQLQVQAETPDFSVFSLLVVVLWLLCSLRSVILRFSCLFGPCLDAGGIGCCYSTMSH